MNLFEQINDILEKYINEDQKELKEKYNVETVYAPKNLYISKVQSYDGISSKEKEHTRIS